MSKFSINPEFAVQPEVEQIVAFMGGKIEGTGGGCSHIVFEHGDTETWIVSVELEDSAPRTLDELSDAWFHDKDAENDPDNGSAQRATLREILLDLYGNEEGSDLPTELAALRG